MFVVFFTRSKTDIDVLFFPKYINLKTVNGITVLKCYKNNVNKHT